MLSRKLRSCFIIGPMGDAEKGDNSRLLRLAKRVLEPLMSEIEARENIRYKVETPFNARGEHIMNDVIYAIDRADLIIADLTDYNPNVFYELGIVHALGRACITVIEERNEKIPFDNAAYRAFKINLDEDESMYYEQARNRLRDAVERAHRKISEWTYFENPVIDFFNAPITYISPAYSLAQGYYVNFIKPVVEAMTMQRGKEYLYKVEISDDENAPGNPQALDTEMRRKLKLQIIVPTRISQTKHRYADRFRGRVSGARVEGNGRDFSCFYRNEGATNPTLVDIPTTVRVMEDAVARRMRRPNVNQNSIEWREVEEQELDRFALILQHFIDKHEESPEFASHIQILRYDEEQPNNLLWLHDILRNN